jgi:hypothetical protein
MKIINRLTNFLNSPLVDTIIQLIKKLKSSKNYWTVVTPIIIFTIREAVAWQWGDRIEAFAQKQIEHNILHPMLWKGIALIFGEGGSWKLVVLGAVLFFILSFVKIAESHPIQNRKLTKKVLQSIQEVKSTTQKTQDEIQKLQKYIQELQIDG